MRKYSKVSVRVGLLEFPVEMWTEHNHSEVWSYGECIFDGFVGKAIEARDKEVARMVSIAESSGFDAEIIRNI